jgi:STE24 endopeptidase
LPALGASALAIAGAVAARRILRPSQAPPAPAVVALEDHFSSQEIARGRRFARPQMVLGLAHGALDALTLAAVVLRCQRRAGTPPGLERSEPPAARAVAQGALLMGALSIGLSLPGLPLAALARRRARAAGLVTQSWRDWSVDLLRAQLLQGAFAAGGAAGVVAMMRRWPRAWWAPAAGASVLLAGILGGLAPILLDPIFNDFTRLPDGPARADVLALAELAGVRVGEVFTVDASRRTTAGNAYVAGWGPTRRVVLFDTLLERFDRREVRVVVAHELAHVRHRDVLRRIAFSALCAPGAALAAQRIGWWLHPQRGTPATLPALAAGVAIVSGPIGIVAVGLSRALERRADWFALQLTASPDEFVSFQRRIALQNIADLDPPRPLRLLASHPSTLERIGAAETYRLLGAAAAAAE